MTISSAGQGSNDDFMAFGFFGRWRSVLLHLMLPIIVSSYIFLNSPCLETAMRYDHVIEELAVVLTIRTYLYSP